jgi:hypothetical protein
MNTAIFAPASPTPIAVNTTSTATIAQPVEHPTLGRPVFRSPLFR